MLTEKEAWEFLADLWSNATQHVDEDYKVQIQSKYAEPVLNCCFGVCSSVEDLNEIGKIDGPTMVAMLEKIDKEAERLNCPEAFIWPNDLAGAASRAEFCRREADALGT